MFVNVCIFIRILIMSIIYVIWNKWRFFFAFMFTSTVYRVQIHSFHQSFLTKFVSLRNSPLYILIMCLLITKFNLPNFVRVCFSSSNLIVFIILITPYCYVNWSTDYSYLWKPLAINRLRFCTSSVPQIDLRG